MKKNAPIKPWFAVLEAARRVQRRGDLITSSALAAEAEIPTPIASAWLFKFERFGYVLRGDKYITGKRWSWSWALTRWGLRFREKKVRAPLKLVANPKKDGEPVQ